MRATLVAAAAALATLAAPAAADCLVCSGHLTAGAGSITLAGRGVYPNDRFVARCTYDGATLTMTLTATADGGDSVGVEGECVLYAEKAATGVWTSANGVGPVLHEDETRADAAAPPARQLCLNASAYWQDGHPDADSVSYYQCVDAAAFGG